MQPNLPTLREDPLPIVIVSFEDPTEPGVSTSDVVQLTGLWKKGTIRVRTKVSRGLRRMTEDGSGVLEGGRGRLTSSVERKIRRYSLSSSVAYRSRREFLKSSEKGRREKVSGRDVKRECSSSSEEGDIGEEQCSPNLIPQHIHNRTRLTQRRRVRRRFVRFRYEAVCHQHKIPKSASTS